MHSAQMAEMRAVLDHCTRSEEVKVLVLTGAGRAFCSGADQKNFNSEIKVPARTMQLLDKRYAANEVGTHSARWRRRSSSTLGPLVLSPRAARLFLILSPVMTSCCVCECA